jgi:predicted RNA-binding Zn-ribbon protein involved in translation (DUF1610 family)
MTIDLETRISARFQPTSREKRCPECGEKMMEIDRCNENGASFIWYECGRKDCDGQWLEKVPHDGRGG